MATPATEKVNLESLITEELEELRVIRVKKIPEQIHQIGKGAFGKVFLYKFEDGTICAGKKPKINLEDKSTEEKNQMTKHLSCVLGEIKILHQLDHERVIEFFGFYLDQGQMIIFMEAMKGSVKDEINNNGCLSEMEAMNYFTHAAEGLVYLHSRRPKAIIHRDIKCENLLLTPENNVKLADFGLAVDLAISSGSVSLSSNSPTTFAGTQYFIAPEVIGKMDQPEAYGRKSDIWSLACTLVQMIRGEPPYKELGFIEFIQRSSIGSRNPLKYSGSLLPTVSNTIKKLLDSLFIINHKRRPNAVEVLVLAHIARTALSNTIVDGNKQYNYNSLYDYLPWVDQSDEGFVKRYLTSARKGNANGKFNLGCMYEKGKGVPRLDKEAVKWYTNSAEQGHARAQCNLGIMYEKGKGVPQSDEEAVKWYKKSAEQGNADGQYNLGSVYEKGKGVPQSNEEAVKWFRKSAEQGNADGQYNLGFMYRYGKNVPQSNEEAVKWFRKSAEQGNADGQYNLGFMYRYGKNVPQSSEEAVKWFRKSAEQGNANGQCCLGSMYLNGKGVPQSNEEAVKWLRKSAEQGNADGQYNLGFMYMNGKGVPQSNEEAVKWFRKSAEQGNAITQNYLIELLTIGQGN